MAESCAAAVSSTMASATSSSVAETLTLARIGTFVSAFPTAFGCPRQGLAAPSVRGRIELAEWMVAAAAGCGGGGAFLEGLEAFSHVWIIFVFDKNRHSSASFDPKESFLRPTVKPPWLTDASGKRGSHGVFATRSPHRPNPIGLTVCKLDHVDHQAAVVYVSGVDVVSGSAVLDIKPYHPVDSLPVSMCEAPYVNGSTESVHGADFDQAEAVSRQQSAVETSHRAHFPDWLPVPRPRVAVRWRESALVELAELQPHCSFYPDNRDAPGSQPAVESLRRAVEEVLGLDPRTPQSRCRGSGKDDTRHRYWALDLDCLSIAFRLVSTSSAGPDGVDESASPEQAFEVVKVMCRSLACQETRVQEKSSKAWLERLREELEQEELESQAVAVDAAEAGHLQ